MAQNGGYHPLSNADLARVLSPLLFFAAHVAYLALWSPDPFLTKWIEGSFTFFLALEPNDQRVSAGFLQRVLGRAVPAGVVIAAATMGVFAPLVFPNGVAAFGRDPEAARAVWSQ